MVSLQTLLLAEEIQKDARDRAKQARLLNLLPRKRGTLAMRFQQVGVWLGMLVQTWQGFARTRRVSAPCPTC